MVLRIDPRTDEVVDTIDVGQHGLHTRGADGPVRRRRHLRRTRHSPEVVRIDGTGKVARINVEREVLTRAVATPEAIWFSNWQDRWVTRVDRASPPRPISTFAQVIAADLLGRYSNSVVTGVKIEHARAEAERQVRVGGSRRWQPHALKRRFSAARLEQLIADYRSGMGCVVLAQKYGVSENAVLAQLRRAGVELRSSGKVTPDDVVEMRRLRQEGWTYQAIGEKFGVTRMAVKRRLGQSEPPTAG